MKNEKISAQKVVISEKMTKDDLRDSMVIYRLHYEGIKELTDTEFASLCRCIFEYGFYKKEMALSGTPRNYFQNFIKAQIDANWKKYEVSKKGGRPKKINKIDEDEK